MAKHFGDWILGDKSPLVYTVEETDGTTKDITGTTCTLEGRRTVDSAFSISITGTLTDPANGLVTFSDLTNGLTLSRPRDVFLCAVKITGGSPTPVYTERFEIGVVAWP